MTIACLDVCYDTTGATAACVVIADWPDEQPIATYTAHISDVHPYEPGHFYKRELPCLLKVLQRVTEPVDVVVIDGYVWLRGRDDPGLGAHLYDALGKNIPIIGVAKSSFNGCREAREVLRGDSQRPLFVTARGMELEEAARHLEQMHGPYRLPTILRQVDQLCRGIRS